jgi:endonuclease/exonuclease/phosphatase family metal-dependent hydrolase
MYLAGMIAAAALAVAPGLEPTPVGYTTASPGPAFERPLSSAPVARTDTVEISVLTYNVHGLPWPLAKGRPTALKAIGRELAQMRAEGRQPDIVLIQEGFRSDAETLVKLSGYKHWARGPGRAERAPRQSSEEAKRFRAVRYPQWGEGWGKLVGAGLYVLSDAPILDVQSAAYRYCAGLDCLANKGVMLVRVAVPGVPGGVDVLNTHLNSKGASRAPLGRTLAAHNLQVD